MNLIWAASTLAQGALAAVLIFTGTWRRLPAFALFCLAGFGRTLYLRGMPVRSDAYASAWAWTDVALLALLACCVLELLVWLDSGYGRLGRWRWRLLIAITACACLGIATIHLGEAASAHSPLMRLAIRGRVWISWVLLFAVGAAGALRAWLPGRHPRAVAHHHLILALYLASNASAYLAYRILGPAAHLATSAILLGLTAIFYAAWPWGLRRAAWERPEPIPGHGDLEGMLETMEATVRRVESR